MNSRRNLANPLRPKPSTRTAASSSHYAWDITAPPGGSVGRMQRR